MAWSFVDYAAIAIRGGKLADHLPARYSEAAEHHQGNYLSVMLSQQYRAGWPALAVLISGRQHKY